MDEMPFEQRAVEAEANFTGYPEDDLIGVYVTARNNDGDVQRDYGFGPTVDEAVAQAVESICVWQHDWTYVMDDWEAA